MEINILFIGDVVGEPGLRIVEMLLPNFKKEYKIDFCVANGENLADGKGITPETAQRLFNAGVNVITTGNHVWDKLQQVKDYLISEPNLIRPLNYPKGTYGKGYVIYNLQNGKGKVAVVNLQGRIFLYPIDCPFRTMEMALSKIAKETKVIIVDMHAETTAEKMAMGWYLDGRVSAVIGTHTHIPTIDARILPNGTGYITDVGMTGPYDSVIGMEKRTSILRFLYQTPHKYEVAQNDVKFSAVFLCVDSQTGKALKIENIIYPEFNKTINEGALQNASANNRWEENL
ncbi:MAG: TIGR00282 family metallophosphoesterase [Candidatus Kryptonium sp.]